MQEINERHERLLSESYFYPVKNSQKLPNTQQEKK